MTKTRKKVKRAAKIGHNSKAGVAGEQLLGMIERIERLNEEKAGLAEDIKEIYAGAKAVGFDTKIMRKVVALRKRDKADLAEEEALVDTYLHAIGDDDE